MTKSFDNLLFLIRQVGTSTALRLLVAAGALAMLDTMGVAVVFPYLTVISAAPSNSMSPVVSRLKDIVGVTSHIEFVIVISLLLMGFFVLKFCLNYFFNRVRFHASAAITTTLSDQLIHLLLNADYGHLSNVSVAEATGVVNGETIHAVICLDAWVTIATEALFLLLILLAVIAINPYLAMALVGMLMVVSLVLYVWILKAVAVLGAKQAAIHLRQYRFLHSIVTAIKDMKILRLEGAVESEHQLLNSRYARAVASFNLYQTLPRSVIELFIMLALLGACVVVLRAQVDIAAILPLVGFLAVSSLRVIPSYSRLIGSYNSFTYYEPSLALIKNLYESLSHRQVSISPRVLGFAQHIEIRHVRFSHGPKLVLDDVSLVIPKGSSIGIVGLSGSGKTTFLDVLAGLRRADHGEFFIDGVPFDPFQSDSLRRLLGYVSQNVTLVDDTIAFNIAFEETWDVQRLRRAAQIARIEHVIDALPGGFTALVGEGGVRLSGGQKQRIGIARALYQAPEILIFDEATSALDNLTERELTDEIAALAGDKTIIVVAHRLSSIIRCDVIYLFDEGRIAGRGTHSELLSTCPAYRQLYHGSAEAVHRTTATT
ncbi:MAG: ABC transporter ATP-binding protein [Nitrospira sp.]|nr:ABC transporter ATP-binding protein [Nitrospira sp.]